MERLQGLEGEVEEIETAIEVDDGYKSQG